MKVSSQVPAVSHLARPDDPLRQSGVVVRPQRVRLEVTVDDASQTNFFVGFSGDIGDGGLFVASFECLPIGTRVELVVHLPGGMHFDVGAVARWTRAHSSAEPDVWPGMGLAFDMLSPEALEMVECFMTMREPLFYAE